MVSPTHSLHKISVHWGAKFYSESGLVDKSPFFLREPRISFRGKRDIKSSKFRASVQSSLQIKTMIQL